MKSKKIITARLIYTIISVLLEEAAIVVIVLWGLPQIDVNLPLWALITLMVVFAVFSVFIYRAGSRALRQKPIALSVMTGSKGKVVSPLAPVGFIKIKDELWEAESTGGKIGVGKEVTVVEQDGLKLIVQKRSKNDLKATG